MKIENGLEKRAMAGLQSLADREELNLFWRRGRKNSDSPFGDTDIPLWVTVGFLDDEQPGRQAYLTCKMTLHRSVGNRASIRFVPHRTWFGVQSSSSQERTIFRLNEVEHHFRSARLSVEGEELKEADRAFDHYRDTVRELEHRIAEEIAARYIENFKWQKEDA